MNASEPSFLRLFRRSHYLAHYDEEDQTAEAEEARKECERFAVAALAFCLKYDREFLEDFWRLICRVHSDELRVPCIEPGGVLLEPPHWADLRLVSEDGGIRRVWVVEVKAGAKLEGKQRPDRPNAFRKRDVGYGSLFEQQEDDLRTRLRYIILGAKEDLGLSAGQKIGRICVQQRRWEEMIGAQKQTAIVVDLFKTFGELGIQPFLMEEAKKITVSGGLSGVNNAWTVLEAIRQKLRVPARCRWLEPDEGSVGIYIRGSKRQGVSGEYRRLQQVTRETGWCLAWLGYGTRPDGRVTKGVSLYFNERRRRDAMCAKLKRRFLDAEPGKYGRDYIVDVKSPRGRPGKDLDWFFSVFDQVLH